MSNERIRLADAPWSARLTAAVVLCLGACARTPENKE
jgi:hypothetical protein